MNFNDFEKELFYKTTLLGTAVKHKQVKGDYCAYKKRSGFIAYSNGKVFHTNTRDTAIGILKREMYKKIKG